MNRRCSRCRRIFTRSDFLKDESRSLEADRKAAQLQGVHFFDYCCPACGNEEVFLDIVQLDGESAEQFDARKTELEATARRARDERPEVIVVKRDRMLA